jgi:PII-like signaling protein
MDEIPAVKLTVHFGDAERYEHHALYASLLGVLQKHGSAGATTMRGVMGYGRSRRIYSMMSEAAMTSLPLTIEVVDERDRIERALPHIVEILDGRGLIQMQQTNIMRHAVASEGTQERSEI